MFMIIFVIIFSLIFAREIAGYDSRDNNGKYIVIKNNSIARLLLPRKIGRIKRTKADLNKMTYMGAVFYAANLLVILSIPIMLFLVPEIPAKAFEIDARYIYIFVDTLNEKLPVLIAFILLAVEMGFEVINIIVQSKRQKKNWITVLAFLFIIIIALFILLNFKELIFM